MRVFGVARLWSGRRTAKQVDQLFYLLSEFTRIARLLRLVWRSR